LDENRVFQDEVKKANESWQMTSNVLNQNGDLDDRNPGQYAPACRRDDFVDEDPLQVGPVPLVPDDSVKERKVDQNEKKRESDAKDLQRQDLVLILVLMLILEIVFHHFFFYSSFPQQ
jgi:hypothetical protein